MFWYLLLPLTALWSFAPWPKWLVMICVSVSILLILKTAVLREFLRTAGRRLNVGELLPWYCAWPGLSAREFFSPPATIQSPVLITEWLAGIAKLALGMILLGWVVPAVAAWHRLAGGWLAMCGLLLLFHFGGFHLLALAWRTQGRSVQPIMHRPLLATSVNEFWSRRWNLAFRDFATQFVMRPLARRGNATLAMWGCFLFSGFVHELAISVPAQAGYGLPTAYFLLQAVGVSFERSGWGTQLGLRQGVRGWLFAFLLIGPPSFFLFHPAFISSVILPLVGVSETLP